MQDEEKYYRFMIEAITETYRKEIQPYLDKLYEIELRKEQARKFLWRDTLWKTEKKGD